MASSLLDPSLHTSYLPAVHADPPREELAHARIPNHDIGRNGGGTDRRPARHGGRHLERYGPERRSNRRRHRLRPLGHPLGLVRLDRPWGLSRLPDGSALITERNSFKLFKLTQSGTKTRIGTVPNVVTTSGESGLLGVAVSPNWNSDHYVHLMHSASADNRIVRMTYDGSSLSGYKVLVTGIAKNKYHNGGRIKFGPDDYLYATTGDAQNSNLTQDKDSVNGKILRMTTAGKPAPGNPFGTLVYSLGHRNPQGLTCDAQGRLWEAEFGNNKYDELNLIESGRNYGWPTCEGSCSTSGMTNHTRQWTVSSSRCGRVPATDAEALRRVPRRGRECLLPQ